MGPKRIWNNWSGFRKAETKITPDALLQISGFILREHYQIINLQENIQLREMTEESLPGILKQGF